MQSSTITPYALSGTTAGRLLIIDDFYPNLTTGFRIAEYNHYLRVFPDLLIASTSSDFKRQHAVFARLYPDVQGRVVAFDPAILPNAKLCFFNFLNNTHYHVDALEAAGLPFVFTLYPGGGFELESDAAKSKLTRVLGSPMLRAVISTQPITTDVLRLMQCPVDVHELYGVVINPAYFRPSNPELRRTINSGDRAPKICFVAHRYDPGGSTKGYPVFIDVCAKLVDRHPGIEFAVVGNYGPGDLDIPPQLAGSLQFKGLMATSQLRQFLLTQDLMISPNQPYTVSGAAFDGFPTASCVEASLCGVAVLCADELNLNRFYGPDEMMICEPEASAILRIIEPLLENPSLLTQIGEHGRKKSALLFSAQAQLLPRTRILRDAAAQEGFIA
ncbi:glycosyltransferase [uncultured Bradyrhizobium sp.]|uniref:glycosyltransferase n=1 Tax=uncultured Bradyrhizobium sp. TaxID=199684 RepID=UPI0035C9A8B2